ncbi:MAG: PKD domain-containing protein, partial [Candidatus Cloacimonetes bacterium]|nr:PKD domain-containing protein [Candidatus Cloacimonadota bacterium]
ELTSMNVERGALTSGWDAPSFNPANGRISIVFRGVGTEIPNDSSGSVIILKFNVIGDPGQTSPMDISSIQLSDADGNMGTAQAKSGVFTVNPQLTAEANGPYSGDENSPISFSGSASGGTTPYSYSWDFDDGESSTLQNPNHIYTATGTYIATLTVTDADGSTAQDTAEVTVHPVPEELTAEANGPYSGDENSPISFSGSASGGTTPYSYSWDFDDGESSTIQNPDHTYTAAGTYTATLTVTDNDGTTAQDTAEVTVHPVPEELTAEANGPYSGDENSPISFSGSASGGTTPYSYSWDFDDGESSTVQNPDHTYTAAGTYTATLTVTDSTGSTAQDSAEVTVNPVVTPPVADPNGPSTGDTGMPITFDGSGSFDPDGTLVSYDWDFGDGTTGTGVNPTHIYSMDGIYKVSLTVTDNDGLTDTSTMTITIGVKPVPALTPIGILALFGLVGIIAVVRYTKRE